MMQSGTRIRSEIDFDRDGKHIGFLRLPHSTDRSAYGWIPIPVASIRNGEGPRVLLISGNHGDEYEGQIALINLLRALEPSQIRGSIIILPAANLPAVLAGSRTDPDEPGEGGNLNRQFPGRTDGSPAAAVAHYIESELMTRSEYVFDFHSGGNSLIYLPLAEIKQDKDSAKTKRMIELLHVFGAPISYVGIPDIGTNLAVAARRQGLIHMATELAGGGMVSKEALSLAEHGLRRLLWHVGSIVSGEAPPPPSKTRMMELGASDYYVYSPDHGIAQLLVALGDDVKAGQPAAAIHFPETPWREPEIVRFARNGLVVCIRRQGHARRGDCLAHLASDV